MLDATTRNRALDQCSMRQVRHGKLGRVPSGASDFQAPIHAVHGGPDNGTHARSPIVVSARATACCAIPTLNTLSRRGCAPRTAAAAAEAMLSGVSGLPNYASSAVCTRHGL